MEFGIWLKHHRKIWNFTRRSRVKFQIFLWCLKAKFQIPLSAEGCLLLTPRHLWNLTKICGVWAKFSQILKICENLAQTPQILVKFHRFWVVISGGEWCYSCNKHTSWVVLTFSFQKKHVFEILSIYALFSQNFIVAIYALFPQIFLDWKAESTDFYIFRMYVSHWVTMSHIEPSDSRLDS